MERRKTYSQVKQKIKAVLFRTVYNHKRERSKKYSHWKHNLNTSHFQDVNKTKTNNQTKKTKNKQTNKQTKIHKREKYSNFKHKLQRFKFLI